MVVERVLDPSLTMHIFDETASDPDSAPSDDSSDPQDGSRKSSCALPVPGDILNISTVTCQ